MLAAKPYLQEIILDHKSIESLNAYPYNIPAIKSLSSLKFHPDVTFIVGENGAGKSTLIEAIAYCLGFSAEGGTKSVQIETHNNLSPLHRSLKIIKSYKKPDDHFFLRAESFYNLATYMDNTGYLKQYGVSSLHNCSHGESFMAVLTNKLKGNGLYIFDEPEAALSPARQLAAITAIHNLVLKNSQFIIATHSPLLLSYPGATIFELNESGIEQIQYKNTQHFQLSKYFLNNYDVMLKELLKQ